MPKGKSRNDESRGGVGLLCFAFGKDSQGRIHHAPSLRDLGECLNCGNSNAPHPSLRENERSEFSWQSIFGLLRSFHSLAMTIRFGLLRAKALAMTESRETLLFAFTKRSKNFYMVALCADLFFWIATKILRIFSQ